MSLRIFTKILQNTTISIQLFFLFLPLPYIHTMIGLLTIDHSLGRVDFPSLSTQSQMELLFGDLAERSKQRFQNEEGCFLDFSDWHDGIIDDANTLKIDFTGFYWILDGSIQFSFIPPKCTVFDLSGHRIAGTIDTATLPWKLEVFCVMRNALYGTVDFTSLPTNIMNFTVPTNTLRGNCDFTRLPEGLELFYLYENEFTGTIHTEMLPKTLRMMNLSRNRFSGSFDIANLPESLTHLFIFQNAFTALLHLRPNTLHRFEADENLLY